MGDFETWKIGTINNSPQSLEVFSDGFGIEFGCVAEQSRSAYEAFMAEELQQLIHGDFDNSDLANLADSHGIVCIADFPFDPDEFDFNMSLPSDKRIHSMLFHKDAECPPEGVYPVLSGIYNCAQETRRQSQTVFGLDKTLLPIIYRVYGGLIDNLQTMTTHLASVEPLTSLNDLRRKLKNTNDHEESVYDLLERFKAIVENFYLATDVEKSEIGQQIHRAMQQVIMGVASVIVHPWDLNAQLVLFDNRRILHGRMAVEGACGGLWFRPFNS